MRGPHQGANAATEEYDAMSKNKPNQPKRRRQPAVVRVPGWYYAALAVIALVGSMLIVYSLRNPTINAAGMTAEGDFPKGAANAPVTIIEWGSFT
jgi:hypothetical protein